MIGIKIMLFGKIKKKKYTFIMSIGQWCGTVNLLRDNNLRLKSGPLDWTLVENYTNSINVIKNQFKDYFNKEYLIDCGYDKNNDTYSYYNEKTEILHPHSFPAIDDFNFDKAYEIASDTYKRRIKYFYDFIKEKDSKICLVYIDRIPSWYYENPKPQLEISNKIIEQDIKELNRIYGKKCFDILYIKHDPNLKMDEYKVDKHIIKINNTQTNKEPCSGNFPMLKKICTERFKLCDYKCLKRMKKNLDLKLSLIILIRNLALNKVHEFHKFFNIGLKKRRYDFIMPIGQGCSIPEMLRDNSLRRFAGPLDWTCIFNYNISMNVVKNRFERYFEKEDLEFVCYDPKNFNDIYKNVKTNVHHVHAFPSAKVKSFDDAYAEASEKYNRRIKRFLDLVNDTKTKKILLLYVERAFDEDYKENKEMPRVIVTNDTLKKDIEELNQKYGKNVFDILFIKHDDSLKMDEYSVDGRIISINNSPTVKERVCLGNYKFLANFINKIVGLRYGISLRIKLYNFKKDNRTINNLRKTYIILKANFNFL